MSPSTTSLSPDELAEAVAAFACYISQSNAQFGISGGAASTLLRRHYGFQLRTTNDIDLIVQPTADINAESVSSWLLQSFPDAFVAKLVYGVPVPMMKFRKADGQVKNIEIEIFDVHAWPQRPQYDLSNPDNDVVLIPISGVEVPVLSARWLLREKIRTAFGRRGSRKERTDLEDVSVLLDAIDPNSLDLSDEEEAVRNFWIKCPDYRELFGLKVVCPSVLGQPWVLNESADLYWRLESNELQCLDARVRRHKFKWDPASQVWYLTDSQGRHWFYSADHHEIFPSA